jgi:hypothetical protein
MLRARSAVEKIKFFFNPAVDWPATGRHSNPNLMFEVKRGVRKLTGENLKVV